MITRNQVKEILYKLHLRHKEAGYTATELEILTDEYFDDLKHLPSEGLDGAVKIVRSRCKFFPKVCDILKAYEEIKPAPKNLYLENVREMSEDDYRLAQIGLNILKLGGTEAEILAKLKKAGVYSGKS